MVNNSLKFHQIALMRKYFNWFRDKLKPYVDLSVSIFLDSCLIVFTVIVLHWAFKIVGGMELPDADRHFVEKLKFIVHWTVIILLSIYLASDLARAAIKTIKNISDEAKNGR